jgi:hypothetical protein
MYQEVGAMARILEEPGENVVLLSESVDAYTLFPMLARDVLLTLAAHEFFSPKWSARIRDEWIRNLLAQMHERSTDGDARSE